MVYSQSFNQPYQPYNQIPVWSGNNTPPPKKSNKLFVIFIGVLAVVCITIGIIYAITHKSPACLTKADYADLVGSRADDSLDPKDNFYTFTVRFTNNSTNYSPDNTAESTTIKQAVDFYASHHNKSIVFEINGMYPRKGTIDMQTQRVQKVQGDLLQAGIPEYAIVANTPIAFDPDIDEGETEGLTTVTIISANKCTQ